MSTKRNDVPRNEQQRLTNTIVEWIADEENAANLEILKEPRACASCGTVDEIHWLQLTVDWEDYLVSSRDIPRPEDVCRVPLCTRCRAWAEMIEIAEMSMESQPQENQRRIRCERDRFMDSLTIDLVEGVRLSEDLRTYTTPH